MENRPSFREQVRSDPVMKALVALNVVCFVLLIGFLVYAALS